MSKTNTDFVVVGAGIIGINCALALQEQGFDVLVVDRSGVAAEASFGNAGAFAFSDIIPLATPGIVRKAPLWLLDSTGPFSIRMTYAPHLVPWLVRFAWACRRSQFTVSVEAQASLMRLSREQLSSQIAETDSQSMFHHHGQLQLYESARELEDSLPAWEARSDNGIPFRLLRCPEDIAEIQPGLSPRFTHAGYTPEWVNVSDPAAWTRRLAEIFLSRGGRIDTAHVNAVVCEANSVRLSTVGDEFRAGHVVVCAGAWSHLLARTLGHHIPLETERGYNTTLPAGAFDLRTHLTFGRHGFVVTSINGGVRIGGAVELGGLKLKPNFKHARALLAKAAEFMPGLNTANGEEWMGFRPSLPDSLPVIGKAPGCERVYYAFGHGHLGLTQSAGTGTIIADLATGKTPAIDLTAFRPDRFESW